MAGANLPPGDPLNPMGPVIAGTFDVDGKERKILITGGPMGPQFLLSVPSPEDGEEEDPNP